MNTNYTEPECLDSAWITEFKKLETEYNDFYKEIPRSVNIINIYINEKNSLVSVHKKRTPLDKTGKINKDTILKIIQQNKKSFSEKRVELQTILKYNFTLNTENLLYMVANNDYLKNENATYNYLTEISQLNDLVFKETIHFFSDLNAVYFIYKEVSSQKKHSTTKKIYLQTNKKSKKRMTRYKRT